MPTDPRDLTHRSVRRHRSAESAGGDIRRSSGDDFWGDAAAWNDTPDPSRTPREVASGGRTGRWWKSITGAGSTATRAHGHPRPAPAPLDPTPAVGIDPYLDLDVDTDLTSASTAHDMHGAWDVENWDDDGWDVEPTPPPRSGVDPLLARFGLLAIVVTLSVPVVLGLTSGDDADQIHEVATAMAEATTVAVDSTAGATVPPIAAPTSATASTDTSATALDTSTTIITEESSSTVTTPAAVELEATALALAQPAATAAAVAPCGADYELAAGDYWIRIADAADVRLADLLAVNGATIDTVLVPGRSICLPAGARTPAPPTTATAASTTAAPTTTARPTTTTPVTTATPTTTPPTTTSKPPAAATPADVEAIIRSVWPDDLENHALEIAWRESKYQSNAKNYCCYGLFQIYWSAHQSWLGSIGVTSADQLFDPTTNARAAYALYQRAGGFGPWGG